MRRKKKWSFLTSWLLVMAMVFSNASFVMAAEEDPNAPQAEVTAEEQQDSQIDSESNEDKDAAVVEEAAPENEEQAEDAEPARGGAETEAVEEKAEQEIAPMAVEPRETGLVQGDCRNPDLGDQDIGGDEVGVLDCDRLDGTYTWLFEGEEELEVRLPSEALSGFENTDYTITWEILDYYQKSAEDRGFLNSKYVTITNKDQNSVSLKATDAVEEVEGYWRTVLHAHIKDNNSDKEKLYAVMVGIEEPQYGYDYPEKKYLLPEQDYFISKEKSWDVRDHYFPNGDPQQFLVETLDIKQDGTVLEKEEYGDGWSLIAKNPGTATVVLHIRIGEEEPQEEKTVEISVVVGEKVYNIDGIVSDTNKHLMFPGEEMKLTAMLSGSQYVASEDEGEDLYQDLDPANDENASFKWEIRPDGDSKGKTMPDLKYDKTVATVTADKNIEYWSGAAIFYIKNEGIELSEEFGIEVTQNYVMLKTESGEEINYNEWGIRPTEEITVIPELKSFNEEESGSPRTLRGSFDPSNLSVSIDGEGEVKEDGLFEVKENQKLKIKRLNADSTDFNIWAVRDGTEEEFGWTNIWIPDFDCPIEFDRTNIEDDRILMWNDEQQEDVKLTLANTEVLDGMDYSVEYDLGDTNWDEDQQEDVWTSYIDKGNEKTYYTKNSDNSITLHKDGIFNNNDIIKNGGFQVKVVVKVSDIVLVEDNMWVEPREPEYRYYYPFEEYESLLVGEDWSTDSTFDAYIYDRNYSEDPDFNLQITSVKSSDTAVMPDAIPHGDEWISHADSEGTTELTITYQSEDGSIKGEKSCTVTVGDDIYYFEDLNSESGNDNIFPEDSLTYRVNAVHRYYKDGEEIEEHNIADSNVSIKWYFEKTRNNNSTRMKLTANGDICTIEAQPGYSDGGERVIVEIVKDGKTVASRSVDVWIGGEFEEWSFDNLDSGQAGNADMQHSQIYAKPGATLDLTPSVTIVNTGNPETPEEQLDTAGTENVRINWCNDDESLIVLEGCTLTIPENFEGVDLGVTIFAEENGEESDLWQGDNDYRISVCSHENTGETSISGNCTTGELSATICKDCGYYTEEIPVPTGAAGHQEEILQKKDATCGETGLTEGVKCSVCGEILKAQKVIPATGEHTWNQGGVTKQPTTTAEGVKTYTCTVCGETKTETIPKVAAAPDTAASGTAVGTTVTQNAVTYTVTATDTTEYKGSTNKKAKSATVPATVVINGKTYRVTSIAPNAFKKNKKLKKVKIGSNIETIGKAAFQNCTALKSVTIPKSVKRIDASAFAGCKNLKKIVIKSTQLTNKNVAKKAFAKVSKKAVVKVPAKKLKAYKKLFKKKGLPSKAKVKK